MSKIVLTGINKYYGTNRVLKDVDLTIEDGEFMTLLGPSGCGKTTTLRVIAGLEKPQSGSIVMDGERIVNAAESFFAPPAKRGLNLVFQSYALWPHMTVFDNVAFGLRVKHTPKDEMKKLVESALSRMQIGEYAERYPSELSGGQQQRVAIARAIASPVKLLLLDEPLSNLDAKLRESMRFEIKDIQKKLGITVVYVTHDQVEAMTMSDRVFLINNGVVQQVGSPLEIYRSPVNQFVANFVGKANFLKGTVSGGRISIAGTNQSVPYSGKLSGNVVLTLRPENVKIVPSGGDLTGTIQNMYYLGDENDCRVDLGGVSLRIIADPHSFDSLSVGQKIDMKIQDELVYADDGKDDQYKILT